MRYCGGCNPRYDRVAVVKRLEDMHPHLSFVTVSPGESYAAVLVVSGCPARCAKTEDLPESGLRISVNGWDDLLDVKEKLAEAQREPEALALERDGVLALLPHREPILLVDRASRLVPGVEVTAHFYVKADMPALQGHFPGEPVFPGVYTVEAMAQAADLLLLSLERYAGKTPLFMGVEKARFRRPIRPGDTMDIRVHLVQERAEMAVATCAGQVFVAGELMADGEVTLAMR